MNFLRRFYLEREVRRLQIRIEEAPEANDYLRLIPLYLELGEQDRAEQVRLKAKSDFPDLNFDDLNGKSPEAHPGFDLSGEVRKILDRIEKEPNVWLYGKLTRVFINAGRLEEAARAAKKARQKYPSHPYPLTLLAEIAAFKGDEKTAMGHFDSAIRMDGQSAVSIVHLSEHYNEVKDYERTRKLLEQLLVPEKSLLSSPVPPPPVGHDTAGQEKEEISAENALRDEPETEKAKDEPEEPEPEFEEEPVPDDSRATRFLNELRTLRYVQGVIIIDYECELRASDLPYSLKKDDVRKALCNLWQSSMSQSQQMELGEFQYTAFGGQSGGFFIVKVPDYVFGLLFDKRRRLDQDQQEIFEFCKNLFQ